MFGGHANAHAAVTLDTKQAAPAGVSASPFVTPVHEERLVDDAQEAMLTCTLLPHPPQRRLRMLV